MQRYKNIAAETMLSIIRTWAKQIRIAVAPDDRIPWSNHYFFRFPPTWKNTVVYFSIYLLWKTVAYYNI